MSRRFLATYVALAVVVVLGLGAWFSSTTQTKSNPQQRLISTLDAGAESASFSADRLIRKPLDSFAIDFSSIPSVAVRFL